MSLLSCLLFVALRIRGGATNDYFLKSANGRCIVVVSSGDWLIVREYKGWPTDEPLQWQHGPDDLGPSIEWSDISRRQVFVYLDKNGRPARVNRLNRNDARHSAPMQVRAIYDLFYSDGITLSAILPIIWVGARMRRKIRTARRLSSHQCVACGYDLRETPDDQGRYPLNYAP